MEVVPIRSKNKREQVADSAAQGVGALLGLYSGISPVIPLAGSFLTFFALKRIVPTERSDWFPAISLQAGSAMWVLGVVVISEQDIHSLDGIVLFLGLIWL